MTKAAHIKNPLLWLLGLACFLLLTPPARAQKGLSLDKSTAQYDYKNIGLENGFPATGVKKILQTEDGYLWMATFEGLCRYNGNTVKIYTASNTPKLPSSNLTNLCPAGKNAFWVCSPGGITLFQNGRAVKSYGKKEGLDNLFAECAAVDAAGTLWVGTGGGLFRLTDADTLAKAEIIGFLDAKIISLTPTAAGGMLVGTSQQGMFVIENGKTIKHYGRHNLLPTNRIYALLEDSQKNIWAGTDQGAFKIAGDRLAEVINIEKGLGHNTVYDVYEDNLHTFWFATERGLFRQFPDGKIWALPSQTPLSGIQTNSLFQEKTGSIWVGTYRKGVYIISDGKFTNYSYPEKEGEQYVLNSIAQYDESLFFFAHPKGIDKIERKNNKREPFAIPQAYMEKGVKALMVDSKKNLWLAGRFGATRHDLKTGAFFEYTEKNGLRDGYARALLEDRKGNIWVGTQSAGAHKITTDSVYHYGLAEGLPNEFILSMYEDKAGDIWFCTRGGGAARFDGTTFKTFSEAEGMPDNLVYKVFEDAEGYMWAATNKGLACLRGDSLLGFVNLKNGLHDEIIFQLMEDKSDYLWMGASKGIFKAKKTDMLAAVRQKNGYKTPCILYDKSDGIKETSCVANAVALKDLQGNLWFPTVMGAEVINPDGIVIDPVGPKVVIEKMIADDREQETGDSAAILLPAGTGRLEFSFAALLFLKSPKIRYRYRLLGYDDVWRELGGKQEIAFTGLPPGDYEFSVTACNTDGVWSEKGASLHFSVDAFFYQTTAFLVFCLAALSLSAFGFFKWRVKSILEANKKANAKLELLVELRTKEIFEEKTKTEAAYGNIKLLSEIGRGITACLSVEQIIDTVYEEAQRLMPADCFGIGVFNETENRIDFPGFIEKGEKLPFHHDELGDDDSLSDWCFKNGKEVFIGDFDTQIYDYLPGLQNTAPKIGEHSASILYLPLLVKGKTVGNITAQSFSKNAYSETHLDILRNIAAYVAVALENADAYHRVEEEKDKSEKLLLNILPKETAEELKETGKASVKHYEKVSVLFTDFKGFSMIAESMSPQEVVENLDYCFRAFDKICKKHRLEKIKTIGDSYMAAAGIPTADDDNPIRAVAAALEMKAFMEKWKAEKEAKGLEAWEVRIGIHTGAVVAGVVGEDKFAYDIWGDAVNLASRMESSGEAGMVNISGATHAALVEPQGLRFQSGYPILPVKNWQFEYRGKIYAKNKGEVDMYFVTGNTLA